MSNLSEEFNVETHEVRSRAPNRKGYHNLLVNRTSTFNKATKNLQKDIELVNKSMENPEMLEKASETLKDSKEHYKKLVDELEQLFLQDKWGKASSRIKNLHTSQGRQSSRTAVSPQLSSGRKLLKMPFTPATSQTQSKPKPAVGAETSELNLPGTSSRVSRHSRSSRNRHLRTYHFNLRGQKLWQTLLPLKNKQNTICSWLRKKTQDATASSRRVGEGNSTSTT